ncbi:MAG: DNA repair protein RecN [Candidatus Nephrothrix sp. EaCA]|nr:MAG: DNA repair protein RecN [Candidatus Nephrothrix sp. EaCA]
MLKHLSIKNYALIDELEITLSPHLNVITGETGAGKSILLGALGMLLGSRADSKALWGGAEKCVAEGTFDMADYKLQSFFESLDLDYASVTIIRREITAAGKSRAFVNDTPVTLDVLKQVAVRLMDIHSQHETLQLGSRQFQLQLVDTFAAHHELRKEYLQAWKKYSAQKESTDKLREEMAAWKQESDFISFQLKELSEAKLQPSEAEKLESEIKILENAEAIKSSVHQCLSLLGESEFSIINLVAAVRQQLHSIESFSEAYAALLKRIESIRLELGDILSELENESEKIEYDPKRADLVKERLSTLYRLLQKHRCKTVDELLSIENELNQKSAKGTNTDEELSAAEKELQQSYEEVLSLGKKLSASRKATFAPFTQQLLPLLHDLGIGSAAVEFSHEAAEPTANGMDNIEILFSANKGVALRPLAHAASGGEFSRLMFVVKFIIAEKTSLPTLVLDEIDTGISGEIAIRMGQMMNEMGKKHQLLVITHLPQIAAMGESHYFVYKQTNESRTISRMKMLDPQERLMAIASMIGGEDPSHPAVENAKELMKMRSNG